jgi:hypothetical protein
MWCEGGVEARSLQICIRVIKWENSYLHSTEATAQTTKPFRDVGIRYGNPSDNCDFIFSHSPPVCGVNLPISTNSAQVEKVNQTLTRRGVYVLHEACAPLGRPYNRSTLQGTRNVVSVRQQ